MCKPRGTDFVTRLSSVTPGGVGRNRRRHGHRPDRHVACSIAALRNVMESRFEETLDGAWASTTRWFENVLTTVKPGSSSALITVCSSLASVALVRSTIWTRVCTLAARFPRSTCPCTCGVTSVVNGADGNAPRTPSRSAGAARPSGAACWGMLWQRRECRPARRCRRRCRSRCRRL